MNKHEAERQVRGAVRAAQLLALALLALVPTIAEASVPRPGTLERPGVDQVAFASLISATSLSSLEHELAPAMLVLPEVSGLPFFAGDELARALDQDEDTRFHPFQNLALIDAEPLRGPPDTAPGLCLGLNVFSGEPLPGIESCGLETRIGVSRLLPGDRVGREGRVTLGLHWACGLSGCEVASEQRKDPLGLCVGGLPCPGWAQNQINYWKDTGTKVGKGLKEAYDIGYKPMVDQAKEIVAANVRLADSAWDATTGGGKYTRGQSREILDEYVLRSLEVALMVEGFRTPARLPSKATASAPRRWQDFLPEAERRTAEARASWAIPGMEVEASAVYRETFFTAHPELRGKVWVHHSVERQIPRRYPGRFKPAELDELPNLRGIPNETNPDIHLSKIRIEWNKFYREHPNPTREEILQMRDKVDDMFGAEFNPPLKPKG